MQLQSPILGVASLNADSALDRRAQIGALDHLAAHSDTLDDAKINARATDLASSDQEDQPTEDDLIEDELLQDELEEDELDGDEADDLEDDELESHDHEDDDPEEDDQEDEDQEDEDQDDDQEDTETKAQEPANSNNPSVPLVLSVPFPPSNSSLPAATSDPQIWPFENLPFAISSPVPRLEEEILTLPAHVPAFSPQKPDPTPGFPLCLTPKPSTAHPTFEELSLFMPPPSKSFNPFWPESDIFYLCYPGRTDKSNLRSALVSHQEMLARSGAQALVDRHHFTPDQQSHEAYSAAEDFYRQLARKNPPPDH